VEALQCVEETSPMPPTPTLQANKSKNPLLLIINDISIKLKKLW
jgi:hypothetical protein